MRTTVTLDPDVEAGLRRQMRQKNLSFKEALNQAVREGFAAEPRTPQPYQMKSRSLGVRAGVNLDKALQLAGELEDQEILRKLELGK